MKISETRPLSRVEPVTRRGKPGTRSEKSTAGKAEAPSDVVSVMGIPEAEMTPKVRAAIMQLMEEVDRMRHDLEAAYARLSELEKLADQDSLAPIANRRAFVREMSRMMAYGERYGTASSLIFFDLNDLKKINDTLGHAAGDAALVHVANFLVASTRQSDVVGRLGGDEFGVLLIHADDAVAREKGAALAADLRKKPFSWGDVEVPLEAAYGVYTFRPGEDVSTAIAEADKAMYANKQALKGQR